MSLGVLIRNPVDSGVLVDGRSLNYANVESGAGQATLCAFNGAIPGDPVVNVFSAAITSVLPPLIALRWAPGGGEYLSSPQLVGGPGNWTGFSLVGIKPSGASVTHMPIEYKVFAVGVQSSATTGMRIRRLDNSIVIDSGHQPLNIKKIARWKEDWWYDAAASGAYFWRDEFYFDGATYKLVWNEYVCATLVSDDLYVIQLTTMNDTQTIYAFSDGSVVRTSDNVGNHHINGIGRPAAGKMTRRFIERSFNFDTEPNQSRENLFFVE